MALRTQLVVFVIACVTTLPGVTAGAGCEFDWQPGNGLPGVDRRVEAIQAWDPDGPGPRPRILVLAGGFTIMGNQFVNGVGAWDGNNWVAMDAGMIPSGPDNGVHALALFRGELIAGGAFARNAGASADHIARWDGARWQPLGGEEPTGTNGSVRALMIWGDELIVAGSFSSAGGVDVNNIARWDGSGWHSIGSGLDGPVGTLVIWEGSLIAGGIFSTAGGVTVNSIARWDGKHWQPMGDGLDEVVSAVAVSGGELIAGSYVPDFVGTRRSTDIQRVSRWTGSTWEELGGSEIGTPFALIEFHGELLVGASEGVFVRRKKNWDRLGGVGVETFAIVDDDLFAGGWFYVMGVAGARSIARWDGERWHGLSTGMSDTVYAMATYDGALIVAGQFFRAGNVDARQIARWNGITWNRLGSGLGANYVLALAAYRRGLVAGGDISTAGGIQVRNIAEWDGGSWKPVGGGLDNRVNAMLQFNDELIVAGEFLHAGAIPATRIARWNGTEWLPMDAANGPTPTYLSSLTTYGNALVAGGSFSVPGVGDDFAMAARWRGDRWEALGPATLFGRGSIGALAVYNGAVVGALTRYVSNHFEYSVVSWNGQNWSSIAVWANGPAYALRSYAGRLIAAGAFTSISTINASRIASWDGHAWQSLGEGADRNINALHVYGGELTAGGFFDTMSGTVSPYLARWRPSCLEGDMNCDGQFDSLDVAGFVSAILNGPGTNDCAAFLANLNDDLILDGRPRLDGRDVVAFTSRLLRDGDGESEKR